MSSRLDAPFWALRLTFGVVPIAAGLDKFTNLLTVWEQYLSPLVARLLPLPGPTIMHLAGVVEVAAGILVLTRFTRLGAYLVSAWLVAIALSLIASGSFLDVAARDLAMAVGAFALARLAEARAHAREETRSAAGGLERRRAHA